MNPAGKASVAGDTSHEHCLKTRHRVALNGLFSDALFLSSVAFQTQTELDGKKGIPRFHILVICLFGLLLGLLAPASAVAAFGLSTASDHYSVDTGAGLVFQVRTTDNGSSTQSAGDIMSLIYNGVQYQDTSRGSQVNSGFDFLYTGTSAVTVTGTTVGTDYIKITVVGGNLTHYYMARKGYPHIYMATYFTTEPDTLGLCRYIMRIPNSVLPNGPTPSNILPTDMTVESSDVFGFSGSNANVALRGQTRSKHYSNMRLKDWAYLGATGSNVGIWMVRDNNEGNSGGPFFRCLLNQGASDQEITYIVNYGESQTEAFRTSILNSYTFVFTNGSTPSAIDTSWFSSMGLIGYIAPSGRGAVTCSSITGRDTSYVYTIGFSGTGQYWTDAAASNGAFTMSGMIPGTYDMSVYKNELVVYSATNVVVTAGGTTALSPIAITADPSTTVPLWRIGNWDGSPKELLNADKVDIMHPSDVRMSSWSPGPYIIGTSTPSTGMPCYQWMDVNANQVIQFTATAAQAAQGGTIRIGITDSYSGARPKLTLNSWTSSSPAAPSYFKTRSLTVGTYRGYNTTFTYTFPAKTLVTGTNTLTFFPISGSTGTAYLSPGYSLDAMDMYLGNAQTLAVPNAPSNITATPSNGSIALSWTALSGAASYTVQRATFSGGPYTTVASGVTTASYTDTGLTNGATYYYLVNANNSSGTGVSSGEASATPNGNPLIAYLKFDETSGTTASDATGDNWSGTLVSGSTWTAGKVNNAVSLNGTNSYVSLPAGMMSGINNFTIAAWVKLNNANSWSRIFDFGSGVTNYMFLTPQNGATGKVRFAISTGGEQLIDGTAALATGTWTHVAVTLSGSTGTLYVNGTPVGANTAMNLNPNSLGITTQNYIGKSQFGTDPYFNGLVDEFQIYSRALSASEISAMVSPPPVPTGLNAAPSDSRVALNWNASMGATSYLLKRGTASGQESTLVSGTIANTTFTDPGLTNGKTYFYVVSASNANGISAYSAEISAVPVQTFAQWQSSAFPGQSDPLIIGPSADPDGDGYSNLLEYFLATNPASSSDSPNAVTTTLDDSGNIILTFRMSKNLSGVSYFIQQSSDLATWTATEQKASAISDQGSYYIMKATVPLAGQPKLFLRLSVTSP